MVNLPAEEAHLEGQQTEDVDQNGSPSGTATGAGSESEYKGAHFRLGAGDASPPSRIEWAFTWPPTITTSSRSSGFEDITTCDVHKSRTYYRLNDGTFVSEFQNVVPEVPAHDYDELDAPER
ncbi:hypothetical protein EVAR_79020_1 [Eumeta japonica]|uniref:Uncharacterized protein n=1 Tax=Eumeta variegata TaxID=151549 RepID=A0A4C2AFN3_EUMVA|nr:hypothetical protein EVAR_79020_1 [Eumeta japonica]